LNFPPKADVWSFAMVCSEILISDVPFTNESQVILHTNESQVILHAKIKKLDIRPPLPSDCPKGL
jgi:hypothetical protein